MIHRYQRGKFNLRCLFGHAWLPWSKPMIRDYRAGMFIAGSYIWQQRSCSRCGAKHGTETPND